MFTYIKNEMIGKYFNSEVAIETIDGYQDTVGTTWQDYLNGKFVLLNDNQLDFKANNPSASVEEVFNMKINEPEIVIEPERILDDAKSELHNQVDILADSLKTISLNEENVWFEDRANIKLQVEAEANFGRELVTIYDTNDNGHEMPFPEANNVLLVTEYRDTQIKEFARDLHSQIETIPSLEVADMINVEEYTESAPETPQINVNGYIPQNPQEPQQQIYSIIYKTVNCYDDNGITEVLGGESWKTTVYPNEGLAIYRNDFVAEMNGQQLPVIFNDDINGRKEYASSAYIYVEKVTGDILIAGIAY